VSEVALPWDADSRYPRNCRQGAGEEPEAKRRMENFAVLDQVLDFPFFTEVDIEEYRRSWRVPGAIEAALRWYQVEGIGPAAPDGTPARGNYVPDVAPLTVNVPTMVIYPDADLYIRPGAHRGRENYVPTSRFTPCRADRTGLRRRNPIS
jgi:hypothetical protein